MARTSTSRADRALIALIAAFALLLIAVSLLFLSNARRMSQLLVEYDASRLASVMLEEYVESSELYFTDMTDRVLGAGIYGGRGELIDGFGDPPETVGILESGARDARFDFDPSARTVTLVRPVQIRSILDDRLPPGPQSRQPAPRRPPDLRYQFALRADADSYVRTQGLYRLGMILVPLLTGLLAVLLGRALIRARRAVQDLAGREELARLGEGARTIAHEIKNPLNAIRLRTRVLRDVVPESSMEDLVAVEHEVDRLRRLSDRVGDFIRDPLGAPETLSVLDLLAEIVHRSHWNVDVETTDDTASALVRFDRTRLESVLTNVLANAADAQPEGEVITVRLTRERGSLTLTFLDRGSGMTNDEIERAFDPFFTTKAHGSGVGLAIVRRFVEAAGGTIGITSSDSGTNVSMTLPEISP